MASIAALSVFAQSCSCEEVYINRVQRELQVTLDPSEVENTEICKDAEGNTYSAQYCTVDMGEVALNSQENLRTIQLLNVGTPNLEIYAAKLQNDSPLLDSITLFGDVMEDRDEPIVLTNSVATALRVLVVPTVEWEAGDWIGTVSVYSNAENTDETLDDATCEAEGVPAPCARTNIELRAWPRDLGNVDIQVVAEVGTDIFETGICNFGAVGVPDQQAGTDGGEGRCKLRVRNNGDRDAVVTRLDLVIGQSERLRWTAVRSEVRTARPPARAVRRRGCRTTTALCTAQPPGREPGAGEFCALDAGDERKPLLDGLYRWSADLPAPA